MESQCVTTLRESHSPFWLSLWLIVDHRGQPHQSYKAHASTSSLNGPHLCGCPHTFVSATSLALVVSLAWATTPSALELYRTASLRLALSYESHLWFAVKNPHTSSSQLLHLLVLLLRPDTALPYCTKWDNHHVPLLGLRQRYTRHRHAVCAPLFVSRSGRAIGPAIRLTLFSCCLLLQTSPDNSGCGASGHRLCPSKSPCTHYCWCLGHRDCSGRARH